MILAHLPIRGGDRHGAGHWHASRGSRLHRGVDLACYPDTGIASPVDGIVTKIGYPYGDDLTYRYVQVTGDRRKGPSTVLYPACRQGRHEGFPGRNHPGPHPRAKRALSRHPRTLPLRDKAREQVL